MLEIHISEREYYCEDENQFYMMDDVTIILEYSLKAIHMWEQKYHKPYFSKEQKTKEENSYFIRCMTLNVEEVVESFEHFYDNIPDFVLSKVETYLTDPQTATKITKRIEKNETNPFAQDEVITAEVVYAWMVLLNIPFECEKWNFNTLMTLIRVVNLKKNDGGEKMSKADILKQNNAINEKRRKMLHSKG